MFSVLFTALTAHENYRPVYTALLPDFTPAMHSPALVSFASHNIINRSQPIKNLPSHTYYMSDQLQTWESRQYYETPRIKNRIMFNSDQREVVPRYQGGSYGSRPDKLSMKGDLEHFIENGALEFHVSVEHWKNPLMIDNVEDLNLLRTGWDFIMDIDCDPDFTLAKKTAKLIIEKLEELGVTNVGVKFSGNRGFHLSVKGDAFPDEIQGDHFSNLYPELPEKIITFIRHELKDDMKKIVKEEGFEDMMTDGDPYQVSDIENGWSSRHLFRAPYSLHSGSGLVSLPIPKNKVMSFEKEQAKTANVIPKYTFFQEPEENEAETLVEETLTFEEENPDKFRNRNARNKDRDFETPDEAIPEELFPPTIKKILEGLEDGRKRGLFILIKFLQCTGWDWPQIREGLHQWNQRNDPQLEEGKIDQMVSYHERQDKDLPPPNYDANGYYKDMGVYQGEDYPNPVSYVYRQKRKKEREENQPDTFDAECPVCGKICGKEEYLEKHKETQHQQVYKS